MTEKPAPPPRRNRRLMIVALLVVMAAVGWMMVTSHLTSAPRDTLAPIENRLRATRVSMAVLPPTRPPWFDLLNHFVIYVPFGVMAGVAGWLAGERWNPHAGRIAAGACVLLAAAWVLWDEARQIALPDRNADWDDLIAGWCGVLAGWLLFVAARRLLPRLRRLVTRQPQPSP